MNKCITPYIRGGNMNYYIIHNYILLYNYYIIHNYTRGKQYTAVQGVGPPKEPGVGPPKEQGPIWQNCSLP